MPAKFDKCVRQVMAQGRSKSSSFAICTSQFKKAGLPTTEKIEDVELEYKEKVDENGDIIVAENVKIYLDANVSVIEE